MIQCRRDFLVSGAAAIATFGGASPTRTQGQKSMYGLIGKMTAVPGQRDELIAILLDATDRMPGCLSYVIAKDTSDANAIWVTEVWDSKASHEASLSIPSVKAAITKGRPLIASFSDRVLTEPVGGYGLA
jgi:quinol monooxygenase YgiN